MRTIEWFLKIAGVVLLGTAFAKIFSAVGESRILGRPDPIFDFMSNRQLMLLVGGIELCIAWAIFFKRDVRLNTLLLTWLTASFLIYRLALWLIGYDGECSCLGQLTDAVGIGAQTAQNIMVGVLAFLTLGTIYTVPKVFSIKETRLESDSASCLRRS